MCDIFDQLHLRDIFILGVTDCVLNLCPHHKSFSSNCFKTVVGMFS